MITLAGCRVLVPYSAYVQYIVGGCRAIMMAFPTYPGSERTVGAGNETVSR